MSNIKNSLKAGFLASASLLVMGCNDDTNSSATSSNTNPPAAALSSGSTLNTLKLSVPQTVNDANTAGIEGAAINQLSQIITALSTPSSTDLNKAVVNLVNQLANSPQVMNLLKGTSTGQSNKLSSIGLADASTTPAASSVTSTNIQNHFEALFFEGNLDTTLTNRLQGGYAQLNLQNIDPNAGLTLPVLFIRNAAVYGSAAPSTSNSPASTPTIYSRYAYIAIDGTLGFDVLRMNSAAKSEILLPTSVNALPADTTTTTTTTPSTSSATALSSGASHEFSLGTDTTSTSDTTTTSTSSSTSGTPQKTSKKTSKKTNKLKNSAATANTAQTNNTLITNVATADTSGTFIPVANPKGIILSPAAKDDDFHVRATSTLNWMVNVDHAQFDIGGRVYMIDTLGRRVVIQGISDAKPELIIPATIAASTDITTVDTTNVNVNPTTNPTGTTATGVNTTSTGKKKTSKKKQTGINNENSIKKKKAPNLGSYTQNVATAQDVVKTTVIQGTDRNKYAFLFQINRDANTVSDPKNLAFSEIENLVISQNDPSLSINGSTAPNAVLHVIGHYTMTVHNLTLNDNLGISVYDDATTFDQLNTNNIQTFADLDAAIQSNIGSAVTNPTYAQLGQGLMQVLQQQSSIVTSNALEDNVLKGYLHYDEAVPFALYLTQNLTNSGNFGLRLTEVDVSVNGGGSINQPGVYTLPLVKDFTGQLPETTMTEGEELHFANVDSPESNVPNATGNTNNSLVISDWRIKSNGYHDYVLLVQVTNSHSDNNATANNANSAALKNILLSAKVQQGTAVLGSKINATTETLNPNNLFHTAFGNVSLSRINQMDQFAAFANGINTVTAEKVGRLENYAASVNHKGTQLGFNYSVNGENPLTGGTGSAVMGVNVASNVFGVTAILSADGTIHQDRNSVMSSSFTSYNTGLTLAKSYNLKGLSLTPMAGLGISSNVLSDYSAKISMARGDLGIKIDDAKFAAMSYHMGINLGLDNVNAKLSGLKTSLSLGLVGYLASETNALLITSEGKSASLTIGENGIQPYAKFGVSFDSGFKTHTMITTNNMAVNFEINR